MIKSEQRWFDILAVLLLLVAIWLVGLRIQVTAWTDNLSLIQYAMLLAAITGMTLGSSQLNKKAVFWMGAAYSLIGLTWLATLLMPTELGWAEKLIGLNQSVRLSLGEVFRNEPVQGPDLFMISMIFTFWWMAFLAGFQLTRNGNPWFPLGVLFIAFLIIDYYPPVVRSRHVYTGLIVLLMLLLMGRLYFLDSQVRWKEKRTMVDFGTGFDIAKSFAISATLLVMVAWGGPGLFRLLTPGSEQQQKLVDLWGPLQDRLTNIVSDLRGPRTVSVDFYGKNLSLGTEISEEETPIFSVQVSAPRARGFRYYWRGYSYDTYHNGGWSNTIEDYETLKPSDWPQPLPEWKAHQKVELTFRWIYERSRIVYVPGAPLSISRPVQWIAEQNEDGFDGVSIVASTSVYEDESYEAEAWVSVPTALDLQLASQDYPDWVTDHYLQLPDDLPESISNLAQDITQAYNNPLEKILAVTQYLRDNMQYNGHIEDAPAGEDPIEWFLFQTKEGFCNYYASAEVLMLRSLGIPARLVVGFVQGEEAEEENQYLVRMKHSHAWPEVYFPGIGWVEFEPTVIQVPPELFVEDLSQLELDPNSLEGLNESLLELYGLGRGEEFAGEGIFDESLIMPRTYHPWREWGIFACVLLVIGFIFWVQKFSRLEDFDPRLPVMLENILHRRGWEIPKWLQLLSYRASMAPIGRYFSEIPWMLRLLGEDLTAGHTPYEQVGILIQKVPETKQNAQNLLEDYELFTFSSRSGDLNRARTARKRLWGQVLMARFLKMVQR